MRRISIIVFASLLMGSPAFAVNSLQLFISGATYDHTSQTWVTSSGGFDLYVVSANSAKSDVIVSMALGTSDAPGDVTASFGGDDISESDWIWGYPPISNVPEEHRGGDLAPHDIYPTWFTELHTGAYGNGSAVGNVQPDGSGNYWDPSTGSGSAPAVGEFKSFHVETGGSFTFVHFDAYTIDSRGKVDQFAPFSHDAQAVGHTPEPGTLALLGTGLLGLGAFTFRRKKQ